MLLEILYIFQEGTSYLLEFGTVLASNHKGIFHFYLFIYFINDCVKHSVEISNMII